MNRMGKYIRKRVILLFFVLFVIVAIYFVSIRLLPRELPMDKTQAEAMQARWDAMGYNKPMLVQFQQTSSHGFNQCLFPDLFGTHRSAFGDLCGHQEE